MKEKMLISDEEIYKLSEEGLSDRKITQYFNEQGIKVNYVTIKKRSKEIYKKKYEEEFNVKGRNRSQITDEEIYKLREEGLSYQIIERYFNEQGKKVSDVTIQKRCQKIYKEKGKKEPEVKRKNKIEITDEEIYKLRKEGLSYLKIVRYFSEQGKKVSDVTIQRRCKEIYEKKGEEEPKVKTENKIQISDEEIYKLREEGLSYKKIAQYFNKQGKKVSDVTIKNRCKEIYEKNGKEEPKIDLRSKNKIQISEEEIYRLREQGLSYKKIVQYFNEQGVKVSSETIRKKCKKMFGENGKEEPKIDLRSKDKIQISDEEIYRLREEGLSHKKIAQYFNEQGKKVNDVTIQKRCQKIYKEKGKKEPEVKRKNKIEITDEEIYKLRKEGLSYLKIVRYFSEQGKKVSDVTIQRRCKEIYEKKGEEEPKVKTENKIQISDEEIYMLREQGWTYRKIAKYFNEQGKKVSDVTIKNRCKEIYEKKGEEEPNKDKFQISQEIYRLREQGWTYRKIAQHFNEQGIKVSYGTVRKKCKKIYEENGKGIIMTTDNKQEETLFDLMKKTQELEEKKKKSEELLAMYKELEKRNKQLKEKDGEEK